MKIYVIYFRTMDNSPSTEILCVTADKALADAEYRKAKQEEREFMKEAKEDDSSDWADACRRTQSVPADVKPEDMVKVAVYTEWMEFVDTQVKVFLDEASATKWMEKKRAEAIESYGPDLQPFDEGDTVEESNHLCDESVMVDVEFAIESVIVK
jgi:hypothetical protein